MSIVRHTGYNVAASLAPIVVSLATVPAQIHYLGEARFGVLAIFAILLGYFGVFDLGISRAAVGLQAVERRLGRVEIARHHGGTGQAGP